MNLRINRLCPSRAEGAYLLCRAATLACALFPVPCFLFPASATALAQTALGPGFSFQGRLFDGSLPAGGVHQMMFRLYDAEELGNQIGSSFEDSVTVDADGLFTVEVDSSSFGPLAFDGHERWLEIIIDDTTTLLPRQKLTAAPYAHQAKAAFALDAADGSPRNAVVVNNQGYVGVGTTPAAGFDVNSANGIRLGLQGTGGGQLQIINNLNDNKIYMEAINTAGDGHASELLLTGHNGNPVPFISLVANNVGIGTSSTSDRLSVVDRIGLYEGSSGGAELRFDDGTALPNGLFRLRQSGGLFRLEENTAPAGDFSSFNAVLAADGGNVGINNTAPETLLHILNGSDVTASGGGYIQMGPSTAENIALDNNEIQARYNGVPAILALNFEGGDVQMCPVGGNVGIGTNIPASKLHVKGNSGALSLEGTDDMFIAWYPDGIAAGRKAFTGFGSAADNNFSIVNEVANAHIVLQTTGAGGNVGIGTTGPAAKLDVAGSIIAQDNLVVEGIISAGAGLDVNGGGALPVAEFDRTTGDGIIVNFRRAGTIAGSITVTGTTVSYNAFTGSHYAWTDEKIEPGMLVVLSGDNRRRNDDPASEIVYGVAVATSSNDPTCLGAYLGLQSPTVPYGSDNPHLVMAAGNGELWVVDTGQDIHAGDRLISSHLPGHAMKDDPHRFPIGYVVARAGEAVDWGRVSPSADGLRRARISVLFESSMRDSGASDLERRIAEQQRAIGELRTENAELKARLERLETMVATMAAPAQGSAQ